MRLNLVKRKDVFHVDGYSPSRKRIRISLKTSDLKQAEELRSHLEKKLWHLHIYGTEANFSFHQAAKAYAEDGGDIRFLSKILKHIGSFPLKSITPLIIRNLAKKIYPKGSPATRNRQGITPIQSVINHAHTQGWCSSIRVKRFSVEKPTRETVGIEYLFALKEHAPVNLFALMLFLHTTGRRVGDAVALKPENLDLQNAKVYIKKTKNGDAVTVHLVPALVDLLKNLETHNGHVFGYKERRTLYSTLRRSCERAGIKYLGTHQVGRHSFATALANQNWTSKRIADAGGWKSVRLVDDTYIHSNDPGAEATKLMGKNWTTITK